MCRIFLTSSGVDYCSYQNEETRASAAKDLCFDFQANSSGNFDRECSREVIVNLHFW